MSHSYFDKSSVFGPLFGSDSTVCIYITQTVGRQAPTFYYLTVNYYVLIIMYQ